MTKRSKDWRFTMESFNEDDATRVFAMTLASVYMVCARGSYKDECGIDAPYLQGCVRFHSIKSSAQLREEFILPHATFRPLEKARSVSGCPFAQAAVKCAERDPSGFLEYGERPVRKKKKNKGKYKSKKEKEERNRLLGEAFDCVRESRIDDMDPHLRRTCLGRIQYGEYACLACDMENGKPVRTKSIVAADLEEVTRRWREAIACVREDRAGNMDRTMRCHQKYIQRAIDDGVGSCAKCAIPFIKLPFDRYDRGGNAAPAWAIVPDQPYDQSAKNPVGANILELMAEYIECCSCERCGEDNKWDNNSGMKPCKGCGMTHGRWNWLGAIHQRYICREWSCPACGVHIDAEHCEPVSKAGNDYYAPRVNTEDQPMPVRIDGVCPIEEM